MGNNRLKGADLEKFFRLHTDYQRVGPRRVKFWAASASDGQKLCDLLKRVYKDKLWYTDKGFGDYADFGFVCNSAADAKFVYDDINAAMEEYASTGAGSEGAGSEGGSGGKDGDKGKAAKQLLPYIVAGVVLGAIVLLIATRKRK